MGSSARPRFFAALENDSLGLSARHQSLQPGLLGSRQPQAAASSSIHASRAAGDSPGRAARRRLRPSGCPAARRAGAATARRRGRPGLRDRLPCWTADGPPLRLSVQLTDRSSSDRGGRPRSPRRPRRTCRSNSSWMQAGAESTSPGADVLHSRSSRSSLLGLEEREIREARSGSDGGPGGERREMSAPAGGSWPPRRGRRCTRSSRLTPAGDSVR